MAKKDKPEVVEMGTTSETATQAAPAEEMYPVSEIIPASKKLFGWQPECTAAALKPVKKDQMTLSEVKQVVNEFLRKEIN
jgi:hypothetical protein